MSLSASHHELSLADLIQVGAQNRRTFRVRVRSEAARGEIYMSAGELVHATYGELVGIDAIHAMLGDDSVSYDVESGVSASVRTLQGSWQHVLLEAARRQDEGSLPRPLSAPMAVVSPAPTALRRLLYVITGALLAGVVMLAIGGLVRRQRGDASTPVAAAPAAAPAISAPTQPAAAPIDAATLTGEGDRAPLYVSGPAPRAPGVELALAPTIVLRLLVDASGQVEEARVYRSRLDLAAFEEAALAIAPELRFQPARKAGVPVATWLNWPVSFGQAAPAAAATLHIKGSDTIGGALGPDLAHAFVAAGHPGFDISVEALGSATAFVGLLDGSADIGAASRPVNAKELDEARRLGVSLSELVIGYDGIAVIVHSTNPIAELGLEDTRRLFLGEISSWKQLGGPDVPVHIYSRPSYSGTHAFFKEKVLRRGDAKGPEEFPSSTQWIEESGELVARVASDPGAIAYVGMGWVDEHVRALPLAPAAGRPAIAATAQTVRDGSYPIYRPLLMYTRGAPHGHVAAFLRFVLSPAGQALVEHHGFIRSDTPADAVLPLGAEDEAEATTTSAGPTLVLPFRAASTQLDAASLRALDDLAATLPATAHLLIVGHADAEGATISNTKMSRLRAQSIAALLRHRGLPATSLQLEAAGSDRPLATNNTTSGRALNRRVEIFLVK